MIKERTLKELWDVPRKNSKPPKPERERQYNPNDVLSWRPATLGLLEN